MSKCLGLLNISYSLLKWVADDNFFYIQIALQALGLHSRIGISLQQRLFLYKFFFYEVVMKHDSHTLDTGGVREVELAFIDAWIWCSSTGW